MANVVLKMAEFRTSISTYLITLVTTRKQKNHFPIRVYTLSLRWMGKNSISIKVAKFSMLKARLIASTHRKDVLIFP